MFEIPFWHQLVLVHFVFALAWVLCFMAHSRHRRWSRQLGVVKAEAIRLKDEVPTDLWLAIAPYEQD